MQLNVWTTYFSISLIGIVITSLYLNDNNSSAAFFTLFITIYLLAATRFLLEMKYYRSHGAILASLQFLLLPYVILLFGMIVSHQIIIWTLVDGDLTIFSGLDFGFVINLISLSLIPPIYILSRFYYFYYTKRWSGFVVGRRIFYSRKIPYLINFSFIVTLTYVAFLNRYFDIVASSLLLLFIIHSIKYFIFPIFETTPTSTQNFDDYVTSTRPSARLRRDHSIRTQIPLVSRSGPREISTSYRNERPISVVSNRKKKTKKRSVKHKTKKRQTNTTGTTGGSSIVDIDEGRQVKSVKRATSKINQNEVMIPSGNVTKGDLSCIFCYEAFKRSDKEIILCPHCKFPGHAEEYSTWVQVSNLCARCSKEISATELTAPRFIMSAGDYISKVIEKI